MVARAYTERYAAQRCPGKMSNKRPAFCLSCLGTDGAGKPDGLLINREPKPRSCRPQFLLWPPAHGGRFRPPDHSLLLPASVAPSCEPRRRPFVSARAGAWRYSVLNSSSGDGVAVVDGQFRTPRSQSQSQSHQAVSRSLVSRADAMTATDDDDRRRSRSTSTPETEQLHIQNDRLSGPGVPRIYSSFLRVARGRVASRAIQAKHLPSSRRHALNSWAWDDAF